MRLATLTYNLLDNIYISNPVSVPSQGQNGTDTGDQNHELHPKLIRRLATPYFFVYNYLNRHPTTNCDCAFSQGQVFHDSIQVVAARLLPPRIAFAL